MIHYNDVPKQYKHYSCEMYTSIMESGKQSVPSVRPKKDTETICHSLQKVVDVHFRRSAFRESRLLQDLVHLLLEVKLIFDDLSLR